MLRCAAMRVNNLGGERHSYLVTTGEGCEGIMVERIQTQKLNNRSAGRFIAGYPNLQRQAPVFNMSNSESAD
jgi:hypothetical protein